MRGCCSPCPHRLGLYGHANKSLLADPAQLVGFLQRGGAPMLEVRERVLSGRAKGGEGLTDGIPDPLPCLPAQTLAQGLKMEGHYGAT